MTRDTLANLEQNDMTRKRFKVGDDIQFKAATRASFRKVWRKVVDIDEQGRPLVRYEGWSNFIVHHREICDVRKAAK